MADKKDERIAQLEVELASLGRETRALREALDRTRDYIMTAMRPESIAAACSETAYDRAERSGLKHALNVIEAEFAKAEAAPASPSGHSPNCAIWRGVSVHPESEPLPCDCALASPSGAQTP